LKVDAWAVISAYFEEKGLVRQQLDSFDEFIQNTMQELVDDSGSIRVSPEIQHSVGYDELGFDEQMNSTTKKVFEIKFGQVYLSKPTTVEKDEVLTKLDMGGETFSWGDDNDTGVFMSDNRSHISKLGASIATNTHLIRLAFHSSFYESADFGISDVVKGLKQNSSITELAIRCTGHITGPSQQILNVYNEKSNLTLLSIDNANLQDATTPLCTLLRRNTNLQSIKLKSCNISDEQLRSIVEATRGHDLVDLILYGNSIGDSGCETLATLLGDNNCNLQSLSLTRNYNLSNNGAIAIVSSLANNTTLNKLYIQNYSINTRVAKDVFTELLCNTSSIMDTYHSNHTLHTVLAPDSHTFDSLLKLNKGTNKRHVAIKKILKYHPNIDMTPLFELDMKEGEQNLKGLPYVIALFGVGATEVSVEYNRDNIQARKLSAIYQFAQAMPLMFMPRSHVKVDDKKRKRGE